MRARLLLLARRAGSLLLIACLLWAAAWLAARSRASLRLYDQAFGSTVAHRFASAITRVAREPRSVLLAGASSTRDGFDEEVMAEAAPGWRFVNGGTGMGSVFVYEALTEMLRDYRARPSVLVIGLHPLVLADRQINFNGAGYTDFFDWWHGRDVVGFDDPRFWADDERELRENSLWPAHRFARQTSRLLRRGLFALHNRFYWGGALPRQAYEVAPDDILPQPRYFYDETTTVPGDVDFGVRWFEETEEWAAPRHLQSLRRTLDNALRVSPRVVVLLMPEHSLLRERISVKVLDPFRDVVGEYRSRGVQVLDRSDALPDALFRDTVHLLAEGRRQFSRGMAPALVGLWPSPVD